MNNIGKNFIQSTHYNLLPTSDQVMGLPQPPLQTIPESAKEFIDLPTPEIDETNAGNFKSLVDNRTSVRKYSDKPISLKELSYLLWCSQGVKKTVGNKATFRTVPSAGARHAIETYILVNNVNGLEGGIYWYNALYHKISLIINAENIADKITEACFSQKFVEQSAVTFIWIADVYRMKWRYVDRGFRYLFLDAGHICQNIYLAAESINCGACAIAAYEDDEINSLLELDPEKQFVIYLATVGK